MIRLLDNARLALRYTPHRVIGWGLALLAALVVLARCSAPVWPAACPIEDGARRLAHVIRVTERHVPATSCAGSFGGFFDRSKSTEIHGDLVDHAPGRPSPVTCAVNTSRDSRLLAPVLSVLRIAGESQVRPSVINSVAIDVIDEHAARRSKQESMQPDRATPMPWKPTHGIPIGLLPCPRLDDRQICLVNKDNPTASASHLSARDATQNHPRERTARALSASPKRQIVPSHPSTHNRATDAELCADYVRRKMVSDVKRLQSLTRERRRLPSNAHQRPSPPHAPSSTSRYRVPSGAAVTTAPPGMTDPRGAVRSHSPTIRRSLRMRTEYRLTEINALMPSTIHRPIGPFNAKLRRALLAFVMALSSGCARAVWPDACPLTAGRRTCTGRVWRETLSPHPSKPRPACRVGYSLDGVPLPVTVDAEDCGR